VIALMPMVFNVADAPIVARAASPVSRVVPPLDAVCQIGGLSFPWNRDLEPNIDYGLNQPTKITADDLGNLFVVDSGNGLVRRYANDGQWTMTVVAGGGANTSFAGRDDLPATENYFGFIPDIAVDSSGLILYLLDDETVRSVDLQTGDIETIAGIRDNGSMPIPTDGQPAAGQGIGQAIDIAVAPERLYILSPYFIGEPVSYVGRLFAIELQGPEVGTISRVAGVTAFGTGRDEGDPTLNTQPEPGRNVTFLFGTEVEVDTAGNNDVLWRTDYGRLLSLDPRTGLVRRLAGRNVGFTDDGDDGLADDATLPGPFGIAPYDGQITIAEPFADRLRQIDGNVINALAGDGVAGFTGDGGPLSQARFAHPTDAVETGFGLFIADTFNHRIRMIDGSGQVSTIAGGQNPVTGTATPFVGQGVGGPADQLLLQDIAGVAADDAGGYFVADNAAHQIYYVDANGRSSLFAGTGRQRFVGDPWVDGQAGLDHDFGSGFNGTGTIGKLRFVNIFGRRYLYMFEGYDPGGSNRLVRIAIDDPARPVTTVIGDGGNSLTINEGGVAAEQGGSFMSYAVNNLGDVFISDRRTARVLRIGGLSGIVTRWAGAATVEFDYEVTATGGDRLDEKIGLVLALDVAVDGAVYYSSSNPLGGTRVFKVGQDDNVVLIGGVPDNGDINGTDGEPAIGAHLVTDDIRVDSGGSVYLKDGNIIRRIDPSDGTLRRVMGTFDGLNEDARHTVGDLQLPALGARSDAMVDFDIATDGTIVFAEDYRNAGNFGYPGIIPLLGANRVRRIIADGSCDGAKPPPASTAASLTMVNSLAQNPLPNGRVQSVAATPDMSYIAYSYVPGVNDSLPGRPGVTNVYLFNRLTGTTELVNLRADGQPDNGDEDNVLLTGEGAEVDVAVRSTDGHVLVAFVSQAGLVPDDSDFQADIYVKDITDGTLTMVSRDSSGAPLDSSEGLGPQLADDGSFVTFTHLLFGDQRQLFKKMLANSLLIPMNNGAGDTVDASISGNGQTVVYATDATGQNPYPGNGLPQIVRQTGIDSVITLVSQAPGGGPASGTSRNPKVNFDGSVIAYESNATDLGAIGNDVLVNRSGEPNLSLNTVRSGPTGEIDRLSAISGDGAKLIVQESIGTGQFRRQRPWLVDLSGATAVWRPLDGAGLTGSTPVSFADDDQAGASYAAMDMAGRRVAVVTPHDLGLPRAVTGISQLYLRDLHLVDATPPITADRAAINIVGTPDPGAVRALPNGAIVYWSNGDLVRRDADGVVTPLVTGRDGPLPMAVGAAGAIYYALGNVVFRLQDGVTVSLGVTPAPVSHLGYNPRLDDVYASADAVIYHITDQVAIPVVNASGVPVCAPNDHGLPDETAICSAGPLDFDAKGVLYFVDSAPCGTTANCSRIRRIELDVFTARVETAAGLIGPTPLVDYEDGVDARTTSLGAISDIAVATDGSMYVAEFGRNRVRRIDRSSVVTTVVGDGGTGAVLPAPALDGHEQPSSVDIAPNGAIIFASDVTDQVNMIVDLQVNLTSATAIFEPGVSIVPTKYLAPDAIDQPVGQPDAASVATVGIGAVGGEPVAPGLNASPLRSIPLRSIPLRSIVLSSIPLRSITLSQIPLDFPGGWAAVVAGTSLAGRPLQTISLEEVLDPAINTNLLLANAPYNLNNIPIGALDLSSTPLRSIAIAAVALGATPLRSIPLPSSVAPKPGPGDEVLRQWCALIESNGLSCTDFGIDPANPALSDGTSLISLSLSGIPLRSIPLRSIPLRSIDFSASPLRSIPLRSISLESSPLRSIPLRSIALASVPLRSIPLRSIPLRSIDVQASPLRSIPLRSIGDVSELVDCSRVDCTVGGTATLQSAADLEPTAIRDLDSNGDPVTLFRLIQAMSVTDFAEFVLGDLKEYGDVTIGDLIDALPGDAPYTLEDLLKALLPITDYPWQDVDLDKTADLWRAASTPGGGGRAALPIQYSVDLALDNPVPFITDAVVDVNLPAGYGYLSGTAVLRRGGTDIPADDPTGTGPLRFTVADLITGDQLRFDVVPGLEFGTQ
jgi:hypothetical protein